MTVIEVQSLTVVRNYLPKILKELERIAEAVETSNSLKRFELIRDGADISNIE